MSLTLHVHVNEPTALVHVAFKEAQLCLPRAHSSLSIHTTPLPVNPALHAHVKEPTVSEQVDWIAGQLCVFNVHSFTLPQVTPLPV